MKMTPSKNLDRNSSKISDKSAAIRSLSDQQLRAALKDNGLLPGPITDSTRELYRKKLESIILKRDDADMIKEQSDQDSNLEDESSDESYKVDEEELNASSETESDEEEEEEDESEDEEESDSDAELETTKVQQQPSRSKFFIVLTTALLVIAAAIYLYSNNNFKIYRNLTRQLLVLLALSPIGFFIYKTYRFYVTRRNEENKRVCELVSEALELLQSPENPKGLMPILHIRDTLLTPAERKSKKTIKLWQKAVKFVEDHESRVKVELVNIDGEDFRAWKWIGSRKLV